MPTTLCCRPAETFWADGTQDDDELCLQPRLIFPGGGGEEGRASQRRISFCPPSPSPRSNLSCSTWSLQVGSWSYNRCTAHHT